MTSKAELGYEEKRQYIRLDTVFPIEFQVVDEEKRRPVSDVFEGFTRNIGKGGLGIFTRTIKNKEDPAFDFAPNKTKLKVIINIPLDKEPIESFATVEWVEKETGPILDTYHIGISYDFINEVEYEKIISYVRWLRLKPILLVAGIISLAVAFFISSSALIGINVKKTRIQKELQASLAEGQRAEKFRASAEKRKAEMQGELQVAAMKQQLLQTALERLAKEKKTYEQMSVTSEVDRKELEAKIEELNQEKTALEEQIEQEKTAALEESAKAEEGPPAETKTTSISAALIESEGNNYNKFRELILNEKLHSLSIYVSTHRSSIYHASALFALAELRYKQGERALAELSYSQVIALYPKSKYAHYASHRIEQIGRNYNYDQFSLKDFYEDYNLPELFDYRNIEPYIQ